ncbi:flagellar biosynthesis protein FlhA [Sinomonas halotolerans]|uniref:Flagellar biosynthesis protein FlhA n=1 Tax=Sinomonas halotolerans TaxID=1644133 RepID=A0ABU9X0F0_9MICC
MKTFPAAKLAVPLGVVGIILLLVVPIPAGLLDVLLVCSVLFSLLILLTSMFAAKPLDFSVFPSLLLVATLFRLGLNVASTRLVLGNGHAGQVIDAMGQVTVGGNLIIGLVIFLILVVIQFVVVTKGAERVAEVGARFALDAMPGKQMAIDADLNAGTITESQARERRAEVAAESDFYGAMDGASKFVKGDAIAGIVIIVINLVGGIAIGMAQHGLPLMDAVNTYSLLTVGDGLVTQIPALLMAVSTGMIVTRSAVDEDLGGTASGQLMQSRTALRIAAAGAVLMGLIPGMPLVLFLAVGAVLFLLSRAAGARDAAAAAKEAAAAAEAGTADDDPTRRLHEDMQVSPLEILLATDLVGLVRDPGDDLLGRIKSLRHSVALSLGFVFPQVRTRDSADLEPGTYAILVGGVEAGRGQAPSGRMLALGEDIGALPGTPTVDPVYGLAGKWIPAELRHSAELSGATVIDRAAVLITHLHRIVIAQAPRLLTREDVRVLTEGLKAVNASAVEELTPSPLSLGEVQRVLQALLAEEVPLNDLGRIFESLGLRARVSTDPEGLVEAARRGLGPVIAQRRAEDGVLDVLMLDPALEQAMLEALRPGEGGSRIVLPPESVERIAGSLRELTAKAGAAGTAPVLVCAPALRPAVHRLLAEQSAEVPVLSYDEATHPGAQLRVRTVGVVRDAQPARI